MVNLSTKLAFKSYQYSLEQNLVFALLYSKIYANSAHHCQAQKKISNFDVSLKELVYTRYKFNKLRIRK